MINKTAELVELAGKINNATRAAETSAKSAMQHALVAGNLLIEAKKAAGHGAWGKWVAENCDVAPRTASAYMRLAEGLPKLPEPDRQRVADLPIREAIRAIATPAKAPPRAGPSNLAWGSTRHTENFQIGAVFQTGSIALRNAAKDLQCAKDLKATRIAMLRKRLTDAIGALDRLVAANSDAAVQCDVIDVAAKPLAA